MERKSIVERWKPVVGYEGLYEVSSLGRVKSLPRRTTRGGIRQGTASKVSGHIFIGLCKKGVMKSVTVHSLVLKAFRGLPKRGYECRHIDGNPANNTLRNLRWGTRQENMKDRERHGTATRGERHGNAVLTADDVRAIRASKDTGRTLAREYGVGEAHISMIRSGKHWSWL